MRLAVVVCAEGRQNVTDRVRFGIVLTRQESEALRQLAADDGYLSKAAWLRRAIRCEASKRGIVPEPRPQEARHG